MHFIIIHFGTIAWPWLNIYMYTALGTFEINYYFICIVFVLFL